MYQSQRLSMLVRYSDNQSLISLLLQQSHSADNTRGVHVVLSPYLTLVYVVYGTLRGYFDIGGGALQTYVHCVSLFREHCSSAEKPALICSVLLTAASTCL